MTSGVSVGMPEMVYCRYEQPPVGHLVFHVVSVGSTGSLALVVYVPSDVALIVPSGVVGVFSV